MDENQIKILKDTIRYVIDNHKDEYEEKTGHSIFEALGIVDSQVPLVKEVPKDLHKIARINYCQIFKEHSVVLTEDNELCLLHDYPEIFDNPEEVVDMNHPGVIRLGKNIKDMYEMFVADKRIFINRSGVYNQGYETMKSDLLNQGVSQSTIDAFEKYFTTILKDKPLTRRPYHDFPVRKIDFRVYPDERVASLLKVHCANDYDLMTDDAKWFFGKWYEAINIERTHEGKPYQFSLLFDRYEGGTFESLYNRFVSEQRDKEVKRIDKSHEGKEWYTLPE